MLGHEIVPEGFEVTHEYLCNLSTSHGMRRSQKTHLRLDLHTTADLRPGRELLPLYPP